jgi:anti-sigma regulatory factor (Ser/Thr protein kinase)/PAS domain-containing protein
MATAPSDPRPIVGRVDSSGRLVSADPELERLQVEAGSRIGASLALPQLAAVARLAHRLRIPVSRRVVAAGLDRDVDMWVRAVLEGQEVVLTIERWTQRPVQSPRLESFAATGTGSPAPQSLAWTADEHLRFIEVAPGFAELLGLDPSDVAGEQLTKLLRLEEDRSGQMPMVDALASRSAFSDQKATVRSTGQSLVLDGQPLESRDSAVCGFEGTVRVDADSSPPPGNPAKPIVNPAIETALLAPLDNIVRSAEDMVAEPGQKPRPEYAAYASDIAAAARHLLSVIRSLAAEAKEPDAGTVDLTDLTLEAVGLVESAANERAIAIAVQPAGKLLARGDARRVIQILINLIGNAIRYSPRNSAVTVSFELSSGSALVHVADKGPGIPKADQARIFEPFEKGSQDGDGSGLGLAIARRLARAMGGEIRLASAPGEGSCFTLVMAAA